MRLYGSKRVEKQACKYGETCCGTKVRKGAGKSILRKLRKRARQLNKAEIRSV